MKRIVTLTLAALALSATVFASGNTFTYFGMTCPQIAEVSYWYGKCLDLTAACVNHTNKCNVAGAAEACRNSHQNLVPADRCVQYADGLIP